MAETSYQRLQAENLRLRDACRGAFAYLSQRPEDGEDYERVIRSLRKVLADGG